MSEATSEAGPAGKNRPKIYIIDPFFSTGVEFMAQHADIVRWDEPGVDNWHEDADGLMLRLTQIGAEDFAKAKKLKVISKQGVGIENVDLDAAKAHGVAILSTPGANSEAVAEMALALSLSLTRRVTQFDRMIREGGAVQRANFLGLEFWGKTIGVVGMGNIGTRIARKWRGAFDARILAYDPYVPAETWPDIAHERMGSLAEMLPQVDLLTVHTPLTGETRHMVDERALSMMKPSAIVINVSRGGIVDEDALYRAIRDGRLFGAGLDVFESEPPLASHPLMSLATVVATPHAAGGTEETQAGNSLLVAQQLLDVLEGRPPFHRVV